MCSKYDINDVIDFMMIGDGFELSELSDEDKNDSALDKIWKEQNYGEGSEETKEPNHNSEITSEIKKIHLKSLTKKKMCKWQVSPKIKEKMMYLKENDVPRMINPFSCKSVDYIALFYEICY